MEYEGSIGLLARKMKKKIAYLLIYYVLGLFIAKKHDLSETSFPSVTRRCRCKTKFSVNHAAVPVSD
jgi:hypothetical protein